jgi:hypothetical protein
MHEMGGWVATGSKDRSVALSILGESSLVKDRTLDGKNKTFYF